MQLKSAGAQPGWVTQNGIANYQLLGSGTNTTKEIPGLVDAWNGAYTGSVTNTLRGILNVAETQ